MQILPVKTPIIKEGDDLAAIIVRSFHLQNGDIVAVSSKAAATAEGAAIDLEAITPSAHAIEWEGRTGRPAAYYQVVADETARMNGWIVMEEKMAILTELQPEGFTEGTIMAASAGIDGSNIDEGFLIGWPKDPVKTVENLRRELERITGTGIAVLLTDSCLRPRRLGVTAMALAVAGFDPIVSKVGNPDLYKKPLTITKEAVADQLATAANAVMGNADESRPAAVIRDHGIPFSGFSGWVPGISVEEDLFHGMI